MSLVTNNKSAIYNGVNQQAAEHRLETQVEESINAYPTVNRGLLKRNPTAKLDIVGAVDYDENMFTYEYDRGLAGDSEEKYSVQITDDGMNIVNVITGKVYSKGSGLTYETTAEDYIQPFVNSRGYSAVTIKDTTFLVNKNVSPQLSPTVNGGASIPVAITIYERVVWLKKASGLTRAWTVDDAKYSQDVKQSYVAPSKIMVTSSGEEPLEVRNYTFAGSTTSLNIDGISMSYVVQPSIRIKVGSSWIPSADITTYNEYVANVETKIKDVIEIPSPDVYSVDTVISSLDSTIKGIRIRKFNDTAFSAFTATITLTALDTTGATSVINSVDTDYLQSVASDSYAGETIPASLDYIKEGFIWVKSSNPSAPYSYTYTVQSTSTTYSNTQTGSTTTELAATGIANAINGQANFSATANGSIVFISTTDGSTLDNVYVSDSYGNQASFSWAREVTDSNDLPKTMGFNALVKVIGNSANSLASYWLEYVNGQWRESLGYATQPVVLSETMPHILVRNNDDTFTLKEYTEWKDKLVGDDDTNPPPSFVTNGSKIKDIFFFKNRLGFITDTTVLMSEVGEYGNFWRNTTATVLDSDRIDTTVDTTKAIQLEYSTYLEDSLMLFSDKSQFKIEGGSILSPKSIQISQTSAYEINKNIRPLFMNNKLFFVAKRGEYSAVMQYSISGDGRISEAEDITSHIETYIPKNVKSLSGSAINNMLFLLSSDTKDTIYTYKYLDSGKERVQSSWFKWTYNGEIYGAFSLGDNLNILINRKQATAVEDTVLGSGIWEGDHLWTADGIWYGSPDDLTSVDNFEYQAMTSIDHNGYFVDASEFVEDTSVVTSLTSTATPQSAIYTTSIRPLSDMSISMLDDITSYTINATLADTSVLSSTNEPLLILRDPAIEVVSIEFAVSDAIGTEFNGFSCVYTIDVSTQLLYNNDFTDGGLDNWTTTSWTINYGTKDVGSLIPVSVELGEWVLKSGTEALTEGTLKFKTCQINSEDGSDFSLDVRDVARDTTRSILSKYTVGRKPMIYGDSKNIRLDIKSLSTTGFRINSVTFEGNYNTRSKRI